MATENGSWIPSSIANLLPRLDLRPSSRWKVFLAVLMTWCRYGRCEARLSTRDIAAMTGLSERTVKLAMTDLVEMGLVKRLARCERLAVDLDALRELAGDQVPVTPHDRRATAVDEGEPKIAPPKGTQDCTSSISTYVFKKNSDPSIFSSRQVATIEGVLTDASQILGDDAGQLPLAASDAADLGLPEGASYRHAFESIGSTGNYKQAHRFVRMVLALQHDERVQGQEL